MTKEKMIAYLDKKKWYYNFENNHLRVSGLISVNPMGDVNMIHQTWYYDDLDGFDLLNKVLQYAKHIRGGNKK